MEVGYLYLAAPRPAAGAVTGRFPVAVMASLVVAKRSAVGLDPGCGTRPEAVP
jgi:hypothetical protein